MGTACNRQFLTLPTAWASAARSQCTYRLSTGSLLGMYGAMRHVLPQSRKTISWSGQPGSRDSACKSHPAHTIFQARLESHQDMVLGAVKAVLECHGHLYHEGFVWWSQVSEGSILQLLMKMLTWKGHFAELSSLPSAPVGPGWNMKVAMCAWPATSGMLYHVLEYVKLASTIS